MGALEFIQIITNLSCGISILAFTFVATASRSEKIEAIIQWSIVMTCLTSAFLLIIIKVIDGDFWGSKITPPPLASLCIIIAISARLNLKGKQISRGISPHKIRHLKNSSEE
tara:strand:+ start:123 stop:458 length:336 start_codon:yes stop_codon:yes gene_type:complete